MRDQIDRAGPPSDQASGRLIPDFQAWPQAFPEGAAISAASTRRPLCTPRSRRRSACPC